MISLRTLVTLASGATVALGAVYGSTAAMLGGIAGFGLVVASCRLSARNGEWSR